MKDNFKIIMLVIFVGAAILGLLVFSGTIKIGKDTNKSGSQGTVILWGTQKADSLASVLEDFNRANPTFTVVYIQKYPDTFDQDLLEALASGTGPDLFFISNDLAYKYSNKIFTLPYSNYPLATFKNTFAGAGEVFLTSKGILAFPIAVDPLVMYYNRNILDSNNIIYPPVYWDEIENMAQAITTKNDLNQINKSTVALGQFSNISHAKNIISTLFMQAGNPIITEKEGNFLSTLDNYSSNYNLGSMLKFYTSFSDPLSSVYSWNRSLPNSMDSFSAENLAFYFGYASELYSLINKNPNQNFSAAPIPQIRESNFKLTSAKVTGIAIASSSKNFNTAFTAASLMATGNFASAFANALYLVPARRDLLTAQPVDSFFPIFYSSALFSRAWLDPLSSGSDDIYRAMVENTLSNNMTSDEAVRDADQKMNLLLIR